MYVFRDLIACDRFCLFICILFLLFHHIFQCESLTVMNVQIITVEQDLLMTSSTLP